MQREDVLEFLIEDEKLNVVHDGERGLGEVRRAVLESALAHSADLAREFRRFAAGLTM
jgi:hypothetical protein